MLQPDYTRTQQLLAHAHSLADAAEAHGTLAGCLCGASGYRFEDWLTRDPARGTRGGRGRRRAARAVRRHRRRAHPAGHAVRAAAARGRGPAVRAHPGAGAVVPGIPLRPRRRQHPGSERAARRGRRDRARLHRDHARRRGRTWPRTSPTRAPTRNWWSSCASACSCCSRSSPWRAPPAGADRGAAALSAAGALAMARDEFARRRRLLMRLMGRDSIAILPAAPDPPPQQRRRVPVPPGQRLPLPHRLRRAGGGGGAGAGARAGGVHPVRARTQPGARDLGWPARRARRRQARLRRRRCLPDHGPGRDPARAAREPRARVLHHGRLCRTSTSAWSAG